ncbi:MAG: class F sortase [Acidimicrobiales bacterium]
MRSYRPRHGNGGEPRRRSALARLAAALGIVAGTGLISAVAAEVWLIDDLAGPLASPLGATDVDSIPVVERPSRPEGAPAGVAPSPSAPVQVEIPAIGVSSGLETLALDPDGAIGAPTDFHVAGWFADGPQPGQPGPAVLAGHIDSRDGPAVFYRLAELVIGDEIVVRREDGSEVRFRVTGIQTYPKDEFPTDAVYGPVPGPELRLITCDGPFDRASHQYLDNLVVYATLA